MAIRYNTFYNELNEFSKKVFKGSELTEIPDSAKNLAEKFNHDINDYIDVNTNPELATIYTVE